MKNPAQTITVLHDSKEWTTELEGEIGEIKVDGQKINDIHDLALKIDNMTTIIKALAFVATILANIAVAWGFYVGSWLVSNKEQISNHMETTNDIGIWKEGKWQHVVNKD